MPYTLGLNKPTHTKNPAAVALGKLAAGKPKHYSKEELAKRTARLPKRVKAALLVALSALALAANVNAGPIVTRSVANAEGGFDTITYTGRSALEAARDIEVERERTQMAQEIAEKFRRQTQWNKNHSEQAIVSDQADSNETIKEYLLVHGYKSVSLLDIDGLRFQMQNAGYHHVSELPQ